MSAAPLFWRVPASSLRVGDWVATDDTRERVMRVARVDRRDRCLPPIARLSHSLTMIPMADDADVHRLVRWGEP